MPVIAVWHMINEIPLANKANNYKWFAIVTRARAEKKVADRLEQQGWHTYLPLITEWRQWSDRKKKVILPMIPSFVFVYTSEEQLYKIVQEENVVRVLRYLGKPAVIRNEEIETLRLFSKNETGFQRVSHIDLSDGELVDIVTGPFAGISATYLKHQGKHKIIACIETTGTFFQVEVALNCIKKISVSV